MGRFEDEIRQSSFHSDLNPEPENGGQCKLFFSVKNFDDYLQENIAPLKDIYELKEMMTYHIYSCISINCSNCVCMSYKKNYKLFVYYLIN